jgi:hypothetical protein
LADDQGGAGLPPRQATGFVESLLKLVDLDCEVPDFSTLCRRQKSLLGAIPDQSSRCTLNLLIDSTGIKTESEAELKRAQDGRINYGLR